MWPADDGAGMIVVDYKTDAVRGQALAERAAQYAPQLSIYGSAVERIWRQAVAGRWLVFLDARQVVPVAAGAGA